MCVKLLYTVMALLLINLGFNGGTEGVNDDVSHTTGYEEVYIVDKSEERVVFSEVSLLYFQNVTPSSAGGFPVSVYAYPAAAEYCTISTVLGTTSANKLRLTNNNLFTYSFPNNMDTFELDIVSLDFYDGGGRLIVSAKMTIKYDKNTGTCSVFDSVISPVVCAEDTGDLID